MKTKFIALFAVLAIALVGCKDEKSTSEKPEVKPETVDPNFKVTLRINFAKDDDFGLYFTEDGTQNFTTEPIWMGAKGNTADQDVVFTFPEGAYPTFLRLDFGMKQVQDSFTLKAVKLEFKGKTREISGQELGRFFRPNDLLCTFDATTGLVKSIAKDGKPQSPSLYPLDALGTELQNFAK